MFRLLIVLPLLFLAGCVSLGVSQAQSEQEYTIAAIASNGFIMSGKATPDAISNICNVDNVNYGILISTRNVMDGTNYAPADNAHALLQTDGAKYAVGCSPPIETIQH